MNQFGPEIYEAVSTKIALMQSTTTSTPTKVPTLTPTVKATRTPTKAPSKTPAPIPTNTPAPHVFNYSWQFDVIDSSYKVGVHNSMAMDDDNNLHIAYLDDARDNLKFAFGSPPFWRVEMLESWNRVGLYPSLVLDKMGRPIIAYYDIDANCIKLARDTGTIWDYENVVSAPGVSGLRLRLDNQDVPHIIYLDNNHNLVMVYLGDYDWETEDIDYSRSGSTQFDFSFDGRNDIHLTYYRDGLVYAYQSGDMWESEILDNEMGTGTFSSLSIDQSGQIHVCYSSDWGSSLKYGTRSNSAWEPQVVDENVRIENNPSMSVDIDGGVHIGYVDASIEVLRYAYGSNGVWNIFEIDRSVDQRLSLILDKNGDPYISFYNKSRNYLSIAWAISSTSDTSHDTRTPVDGSDSTRIDPSDFIQEYFTSLNNEEYERGWSMLSDKFKRDYHCCNTDGSYEYSTYLEWWSTVKEVDIFSVRVQIMTERSTLIEIEVYITYQDGGGHNSSLSYELVPDPDSNSWLIDGYGS